LLGNLPEFARDVLGFFARSAREHGDVVTLRLGGRTGFMLNHPDLIEQVLVTEQRNFVKHSWFWRHVTAVFGSGLLTNEGDPWLAQRRMIQPAFHRERIAGYGRVMVDATERMLDGWRDGEVRDVHRDLMALTLEIVAKVLFDAEVKEDVAQFEAALDDALEAIALRFRRPFPVPDWIPLPSNSRYNRAVREIDELVYRFIREHEEHGTENGTDLLSVLMQARTEDDRPMPTKQIRDEAVTLVLAGHETTALTLSWAFALLSLHPEVADRLTAELDAVLGDRPPAVEDLPRLRYTEHVISESMRLYPPAYAIGREAVADCEIGGWHVAAGTTLFVVAWVLHRDPRWFADPDAFRPERWEDGLAERLPRFAYLPFGGGPRLCVGNRFATMEAVLILAAVARRFRVELEPNRMPEPFPTITLRPREGVRARVTARAPHRGALRKTAAPA
jgi:cytochrome P450